MARLAKLTALQVQRLSKKGRYADGGGLYLQVSSSGSKSWLFRYTLRGASHQMGLGPLALVSLAEARDRADAERRNLFAGVDPLQAKAAAKRKLAVQEAKSVTFRDCAKAFLAAHADKWTNSKHCSQWESTLETYAYPIIGDVTVSKVDTALVMKVLEPIWKVKTETASRVRGRIENILSYATVREWREGDNPARWRGHLDQLLPKRSEVIRVEHHTALAIGATPSFMQQLTKCEKLTARALEFTILTAARTGEAINARWEEIDFDERTWTVPPERMKHGKAHRVPLSPRALQILRTLKILSLSEFVFPGRVRNRPLSNMSLLGLLKKRFRLNVTTHGFRSTFRDWASEHTSYPSEVVEMALAHTISNKVEAAYRRGDLFEKRRQLLEDWAKFCSYDSSDTILRSADKSA